MSFASLPSRRAAVFEFLAASIASVSTATGAQTGSKTEASHSHQSALFDRFMVRGPFPVKIANPLSFQLPDQSRLLLVRMSYPDPSALLRDTGFPVVLFSHEELSSKDLYNPVADLWASHGIVTILPTHLDSESLGYKRGAMDASQILTSRIGDIAYLLDHLDDMAIQVPAIAGHIDKEHVGVGGHGVGSISALALAGLQLKFAAGRTLSAGDARVKALISYNGVGPLPFLGDNWGEIKIPAFAATSTGDAGANAIPSDQSWRWRMSPFSLTGGKNRYGVSITLGGHTYGGLIGGPGENDKPDATGLAIVNAMSAAFITAYLRADKEVELFLKTADLPAMTAGRAFLERS